MHARLPERSNDEWLRALRAADASHAEAIAELEAYLRRVLSRAAGRFQSDDLAELVQESLVRILDSLDAFRGDSAFATWATAVATRTAFTELRRRSVRTRAVGDFEAIESELNEVASSAPTPLEQAAESDLHRALRDAIASCLTQRQRCAILAELRGVPTIEIAESLGIGQNALYKLTHDARKKLKAALLEGGYRRDSGCTTEALR